ncbi:ATP-binding cassette domain-containing protein [Haloferax sp. MBLA0076]|uniref:ATP-binding cassette domain-containing protein n=1 Tax=Haloferax litoreum TaxID=2666140 RepID=A0A6A8GJ64_9EURY|nr:MULTISPECIES: ABC transporter ATP-binding protein [Haloferax]KAB1194347.1 ABC transporter ATP-binding protein [Haloferax sp. CBA1148]MRX22909.1 ATP-binding cassette domain-containing protein [Haloferax litoreum]
MTQRPPTAETSDGSTDPTVPAIRAEGLTKRFGDAVAVDHLDLSIPQGHVYGFLGPNGAGKTTTMRMLTTLMPPTEGTASIMGTPLTDRSAVTRHIGYLPENAPVYEELTGREQLSYVAYLQDVPDDVAADRIDELLDRLDLTEDAHRPISTYSKGMRQKIGLIQALLHEPSVLFLDEPTSGLDPRAARTVLDVIQELSDDETTVFLSTHILSVVDELADTIGVLHEGRLVAEGAPSDLKHRAETGEERTLEQAFLEVTADHSEEATVEAGR